MRYLAQKGAVLIIASAPVGAMVSLAHLSVLGVGLFSVLLVTANVVITVRREQYGEMLEEYRKTQSKRERRMLAIGAVILFVAPLYFLVVHGALLKWLAGTWVGTVMYLFAFEQDRIRDKFYYIRLSSLLVAFHAVTMLVLFKMMEAI